MIITAINQIWEKVFEQSGESGLETGKLEQCPGESCEQFSSRFPKTKGRWKDRAEESCAGCGKCDGNIPIRKLKTRIDDVSELIDEIEDIIIWENAGHQTSWEVYHFDYQILHRHWRQAERQVKEIREIRMQSFLKGWMTEK